MSTPHINDVWARREPQGDAYDTVKVVGLVDHAATRPNEYTIQSTSEFAPTLQTDAAGLTQFCDLVSSGDSWDWS
jgi:hypothetical protein